MQMEPFAEGCIEWRKMDDLSYVLVGSDYDVSTAAEEVSIAYVVKARERSRKSRMSGNEVTVEGQEQGCKMRALFFLISCTRTVS